MSLKRLSIDRKSPVHVVDKEDQERIDARMRMVRLREINIWKSQIWGFRGNLNEGMPEWGRGRTWKSVEGTDLTHLRG